MIFTKILFLDRQNEFKYTNSVKILHTKSIINAIENLGLESRQAKIYLAALESGSATVTELARAGEIERTGIYYHIDKLIALGLLRTAKRGQRQVYLATDPACLRSIVEKKIGSLNKIMPELQAQFSLKANKSIVEYYEGAKELENFYNKMQKNLYRLEDFDNTVYVLGHNYSKVFEHYEEDLGQSAPKEKLPITTKVIMPRSEKPRGKDKAAKSYMIARYNLPEAEYKFIDDKFAHQGSVAIMGNKIYSIDFQNFFASITENKNLAQTWRMFFEYMWQTLPK